MTSTVTGLGDFNLTETSFRRLGSREVRAWVYLRTYDVTPGVKRLPVNHRFAYQDARVKRWIRSLQSRFPGIALLPKDRDFLSGTVIRWTRLPYSLLFRGAARALSTFGGAPGVRSVHITRVSGLRRKHVHASVLAWYCVRALMIIRVEGATSGLQNTEDRFLLLHASSFTDAKNRLKRQWKDYASPYLNSNGQMVSWSLDKVIDVYETGETELDPAGTEVYSKLGKRRMRSEYVWRP